MHEERKFRYENKYEITSGQIEMLKCHVEELCEMDDFSVDGEGYNIRSLYFDDYHGSSYRDNEIGIEPRSKFRIRIYNHEGSNIILEEKIKYGGKISKERIAISRTLCENLLNDELEKIDYPAENPLLNRFLTACHTRMLKPRIIVEYDREAYIYPDGDVRITFDRNISFSDEIDRFFEENIFLQPIMAHGRDLLEVKYTEFLPDFLYQELNLRQLQQNTFSKFYLCERFRRSGGYIV